MTNPSAQWQKTHEEPTRGDEPLGIAEANRHENKQERQTRRQTYKELNRGDIPISTAAGVHTGGVKQG